MTFFTQIKKYIVSHKITSIVLAIVLVALVVWRVNASKSTAVTRYVLGTVEKGTIVSSVTGSGQVSASNQVDVASKVSGEVLGVNVKVGDEVKAGTLLARIDSRDAADQLQNQQISYNKLVTVDPDTLRTDQNAVTKAQADLENSYNAARATLSTAATDMNNVLDGMNTILSGYLGSVQNNTLTRSQKDMMTQTQQAYDTAYTALAAYTSKYQAVSDITDEATVDRMLADAYTAATALSNAAKAEKDTVIYFRDREVRDSNAADTAYNSINTLSTTANTTVSNFFSAKNTIQTNKATLQDAQITLQELQSGPNALDLSSAQLSLHEKQEAYNDYFIRAPFDGLVATVDVQTGDTASSGTKVATLITTKKIASITLNEVDAAKVSVGQKATLTFDAIDGLTVAGSVAEVDLIGTVTQGVVNYTVKIDFASDDSRIKPGMNVSAAIVTNIKQDVLTVPSSAVKTNAAGSYVQAFNPPLTATTDTTGAQGVVSATLPENVTVETGLSDDMNTEIVSGLTEGQQVVTRTITGSTTSATATTSRTTTGTANRGFGSGGGGVRIPL